MECGEKNSDSFNISTPFFHQFLIDNNLFETILCFEGFLGIFMRTFDESDFKTELSDFVSKNVLNAKMLAQRLGLFEMAKHVTAATLSEAPSSLGDIATNLKLNLGAATKVEASCLFVDLRGSGDRAATLGPGVAYVTMHGLVPTLAKIVNYKNGVIGGFRGDGLFALFGVGSDGKSILNLEDSLMDSAVCGKMMVGAVKNIINPTLGNNGIPGNLKIGAGIDFGEIVITKIGLEEIFDVTAYGDSINNSAELSNYGCNQVFLSHRAVGRYPSSPTGQLTFRKEFKNGALVHEMEGVSYFN